MSVVFSKKITRSLCLSLAFVLACALLAYAGETISKKNDSDSSGEGKNPGQYRTFLVYFENDLFADTDQYYTNAMKLTWLSKDVREYNDILPEWLMPTTRLAPPVKDESKLQSLTLYTVAFSLGQNIYTPDDIESYELQKNDRPYAGWLYGGIALHRKSIDRLDTFELSLGIIGPSALGEEAQNSVHRYRDIDEANGWDHQLHDEPGLLLSWQRHYRTASCENKNQLGADFLPHLGITLGNVYTYANIGAETRLGYRIPKDFGTSLIRPGAILSDPLINPEQSNSHFFGLHFFIGIDGRAVARNIFLDGNTWEDSHSVNKKDFVIDTYGGMAIHYRHLKLTYTHVWRSKEFTDQDKPQLFGSISLRYSF